MKITSDKDVLERVLNAILNAVPQTASQAKEQLESLLALRKALAQPTSGDYARGYAEGFNDACKPAQPQQEPVAWVRRHPDGALSAEFLEDATIEPVRKRSGAWVPLYTSPPAQQSPWCMKMNGCKTKCEDCPDEAPKQRKPLTDDQWQAVSRNAREAFFGCKQDSVLGQIDCAAHAAMRAIEAAHGIKETP